MTGAPLTSILLLAGVFPPAAAAQPLDTGLISGTVVDSESGDPIRKAIVRLALDGTPPRWAAARTDGSGHFQFDGLPAGKYDLRAAKAFEGKAIYGANHLRDLGDLLVLDAGQKLRGIQLRLLRTASISGHVYNPEGEPVAGVTVNLLEANRSAGPSARQNSGAVSTDIRGEYHLLDVDPGLYCVQAQVANAVMFGLAASRQTTLTSQYYSGAQDFKDASRLRVSGGQSLSGIDFRLVAELAVEVHGQVTGIPAIEPAQIQAEDRTMGGDPAVQINMSPAEPAGTSWGTGAQGPDYRFQLPAMPAGRYRIDAAFHAGTKAYAASKIFDLHAGGGDIELTLAPAIDLPGTLRVEGAAASAYPANSFQVRLIRPGSPNGNVHAQVGADGRFSLAQVPPGEWLLAVNSVPPLLFKSAQWGGQDVRFSSFDISSKPDARLEIVVSTDTGDLDGDIDAGSSNSDSIRAGIVIAPVGPYHDQTQYYRTTPAREDGKFQVKGLAPGKYKVLALEKLDPEGFRNSDAVDQLAPLAEAVEIKAGKTAQVHLKLIPRERALKALP